MTWLFRVTGVKNGHIAQSKVSISSMFRGKLQAQGSAQVPRSQCMCSHNNLLEWHPIMWPSYSYFPHHKQSVVSRPRLDSGMQMSRSSLTITSGHQQHPAPGIRSTETMYLLLTRQTDTGVSAFSSLSYSLLSFLLKVIFPQFFRSDRISSFYIVGK